VISGDAEIIKTFTRQQEGRLFVQKRFRENVEPKEVNQARDFIWFAHVGCLLTTQQKSGPGTPVTRFLNLRPFPIRLEDCLKGDIEEISRKELKNFRGIRFINKIPKQIKANANWLEDGGWELLENEFARLRAQRIRPAVSGDFKAERNASRLVSANLGGFGPKQSRNFVQWLGYTRFEIPIDSKIKNWVNGNLSFKIDEKLLSNWRYYETILDQIRGLCEQADVIPCMFDAAVFASGEREYTQEELEGYN
jgi:hypothetical protein